MPAAGRPPGTPQKNPLSQESEIMKAALSELVKVERVKNAVAAGSTVVNSDGVQLGDGDSVLFILSMGTVTTAPTVHAEQSSDDGSSDAYADLENSEIDTIVDGDDNLLVLLDVRCPMEEYVRMVVDRTAGNVVIDSITAIVYDCKELPVTQGDDVAATLQLLSPSEGTK